MSTVLSKAMRQHVVGKFCSCLPLTLQDFCLLAVIRDLNVVNTHLLELLAAMPRWLRQRLLNIIPFIDLVYLEDTAVAEGVDVDEIMTARCNWERVQSQTNSKLLRPFSDLIGKPKAYFQLSVRERAGIYREMTDVIPRELSLAKQHLLNVLADVLVIRYPTSEPFIHSLIMMEGGWLFSQLLAGLDDESACQIRLCSTTIWNQQNTALEKVSCSNQTYVTPSRLLPIIELSKSNRLQLLSMLTHHTTVQPSTAYLHIGSMSESFFQDLCFESLDDHGHTPDSCTSILLELLEEVSFLGLECYNNYGHARVAVSLMDSVLQYAQLDHLYLSIPDVYMEAIPSLVYLFSLPNFYHLRVDVYELKSAVLAKLLHEFMKAPCSREQKLTIGIRKSSFPPFRRNQVATLMKGDTQGPLPLHNAALKHFTFKQTTCTTLENSLHPCLYLLLQLPSVRVKEIALVGLEQHLNFQHIHLCAIHPDLQTTKLVIDTSNLNNVMMINYFDFSTFQADLVSLIQIPSLLELTICGNQSSAVSCVQDEVLPGLIRGIRNRSHPLRKISLIIHVAQNQGDFKSLCKAIFSLPQLESLELVFGEKTAAKLRHYVYEQTMFRSWRNKAGGVKLKSLTLPKRFEYLHLPQVAEELLFQQES